MHALKSQPILCSMSWASITLFPRCLVLQRYMVPPTNMAIMTLHNPTRTLTEVVVGDIRVNSTPASSAAATFSRRSASGYGGEGGEVGK